MVVAEAGGPCVSVFSYSGEKLRSQVHWAVSCSLGVAVDSVGNIIVTDSVNCCIKKFTPHGKLLQTALGRYMWPTLAIIVSESSQLRGSI